MEISSRLKTVAQMIKYPTIADVGTDHGYVPIYIISQNMAAKVIACDVNKGPLERAQENIKNKGFEEKIETRLGNGLVPIKAGEVESVIIAGMGGMLMVEILKKSPEVVSKLKQLVLSPHLDIDVVRRYLHSIGFLIEEEVMLKEDGKFYTVISAVKGIEVYENEIEYIYGKKNLDSKNPVLKEYLEFKLEKLEELKNTLTKANSQNSRKKIKELEEEIFLCKEALTKYEM